MLRKVLIVSPSFPPVNAADMQRVRMSLPYFREFGWEPVVLSVHPRHVEGVQDPVLEYTLPSPLSISRVNALPAKQTRKLGLGNLGIRAFPWLYEEGKRLICDLGIDLVYFSTTVFPSMALGRLWKKQLGVPFVLDMQDPWVNDYHLGKTKAELPPKFWFMNRIHRTLEPWTMAEADGLIAVSRAYIDTLHRRYPRLQHKPAMTLPFGAPEKDFELLRQYPQRNSFFTPQQDELRGVYIGRGGHDMARALRILFSAFRRGLETAPELFSRIRLHFIGTDYTPGDRGRKTVEPIAAEYNLQQYIEEVPARIPYFEALQVLTESDFLIVPGSDDPQYTASKIYPYILARKPLICVFAETSSVCDLLERVHAGEPVKFGLQTPPEARTDALVSLWANVLQRLPFTPPTDWHEFSRFSAREGTRKQCLLFDEIVAPTGRNLSDERQESRDAAVSSAPH